MIALLRWYLSATRLTGDPQRWFQVVEAGLDESDVAARIRAAHRSGVIPGSGPSPLPSDQEGQLAAAYGLAAKGHALGNFRDCTPSTLEKKIKLLEKVVCRATIRMRVRVNQDETRRRCRSVGRA